MTRRPLKNRRGMALVLTILVIALLTVTVFDLFYHSWIQASLAAGFRDETKALYAARSGQMAARLILVEDAKSKLNLDALNEEWAQGSIPIPFDNEFVFVSVNDESGKLDLNQLTTDRGYPQDRWINVFRRLLYVLELDPDLSDAVVDWLDSNSEALAAGAEDSYYQSIEPPHRAKNGKFDSVDELSAVKGFTPKILEKLRPYVTVWSNGKINVNTASKPVLLALDENMTEEMANGVTRARLSKPFTRREDIKLVPGIGEIYPNIALLIDVRSDFFSVETSATFHETTKMIRAVYNRNPNDALTRYYKVF